MTNEEVYNKVVGILVKYCKNQAALDNVSMETSILDDLKINSARLVDIVLDFEDEFNIEVDDDDADRVSTVQDAVSLISAKLKS